MPVNEADARIQELLGLITQGEWSHFQPARDINEIITDRRACPVVKWTGFDESSMALKEHIANAEFIALARNRIGPLLEELAEFEALKVANAMNITLANETQQMAADQLAQSQAESERLRDFINDFVRTHGYDGFWEQALNPQGCR